METSINDRKGELMETRGDILEKVYEQIKKDVYMEDFTAIEQLLGTVPIKYLKDYLPEEDSNGSKQQTD